MTASRILAPRAKRYDFMAPHYYVRPDELCDAHALAERDKSDDSKRKLAEVVNAPWEARDKRVFARYSPFCHGAGVRINKEDYHGCPRVLFATLSHNYTEVREGEELWALTCAPAAVCESSVADVSL